MSFFFFRQVPVFDLRPNSYTIMSPKVCGVVSAHKSIRAGEIDDFDVQTDPR